jgi:type I restriction enzyme S subunit
MIDGVPEGWQRVSISTVCTVGRGGSPRPIQAYMDGTVPWFKIGDATASNSPFVLVTKEKLIEDGIKKSVLLPPHELILSNSATCGVPYFTGVSGCIHDGWFYFKNLRRISKWFLYCCLYEKQQEILMGIGDGATQKNLNTEYVGQQVMLLPDSGPLLDDFSDFVEPLFAQIFNLAQAIISLQKARDLLLPRLMSGEIAV